jgi:autophagy-related protein 9
LFPHVSQLLDFVQAFEQLKEFRDFLDFRLGVPDEQVATIEWTEVVNLLVRKQSQHKLFLQEDVQQYDILARICREDNYIIALYNRLDEFFPSSLSLPFGLRVHTFSGVMLNVLRMSLLGPNCLISSNKLLSESFVQNFQELQNTFRRNGLVLLALSPFIACYVIIKAFVGNADTLRRDPASLTSRCWSLRARWQFRECVQPAANFKTVS